MFYEVREGKQVDIKHKINIIVINDVEIWEIMEIMPRRFEKKINEVVANRKV